MDISHSLIGFGEAGSSFAAAAGWGRNVRAFDIRPVDYADLAGCDSLAEAVTNSPAIISVVTAEAAVTVAHEAARHILPGAFFFDMNSVSPDSKKSASNAIEAAGGYYIDTAVMAPVYPQFMAVPLLVSGPQAVAGETLLSNLGWTNMRVAGDDVGRAATIKMLRSVMYKGVEALTAECLLACEKAGVTDEVLESFGNDWATGADYRFDRMLVHGLRRSAEMYESSQTLQSLGISPMLTEGTVGWQQALGELGISPVPEGLKDKLKAILEKMP
jgi:3-hydroxyisobutyrate dehydrogenase-like beta-hydroxyacid dehydrogenase